MAFSGGSDSLALLHLADAWARPGGRTVVALTVDHGLHPQSADWTDAAADAAARLGVGWRGLAWKGEKPTLGLPAAARAARHALLATAARELGSCAILMGHTADDAAESGLIRADTPSHGHLRPWAPSPAWPHGRGVFLLRPLLAARRADLRVWLSNRGLSWLEDPANADPRFARSRARITLAGVDAISEVEAFPSVGPAVQRLARQVEATADGRFVLPRNALALAPVEAARRVVSAALVCAGGGERPPRGSRLDRLLEVAAAREALATTLSGARIVSLGGDDAVALGRDAGERARGGLGALDLLEGHGGVFDGRFEVRAWGGPVKVVALAGRIGSLVPSDKAYLRAVPAWARGALPAVVDPDGLVRLPGPFGSGPAVVRSLAAQRFAANCGLVSHEAELATTLDIAL